LEKQCGAQLAFHDVLWGNSVGFATVYTELNSTVADKWMKGNCTIAPAMQANSS
jgi:hypothetical protein